MSSRVYFTFEQDLTKFVVSSSFQILQFFLSYREKKL